MKAALDQFDENIKRARELVALADRVNQLTTSAVDVSDILRSALVLGVSALDQFVHEFVRLGMLEVNAGNRTVTNAHLAFRIPLSYVRVGLADTSRDEWLDQAIREAHGFLSFQHPEKIADAVRLVSGVPLWETLAPVLGMASKAAKAQLVAIVDRRNKIAHEADMDATNPGARWPISKPLVADALDFLDRLVHAIFNVA